MPELLCLQSHCYDPDCVCSRPACKRLLCCAAGVAVQEEGSSELKVYDLTDYVEEHPGGLSILNNAGKCCAGPGEGE